MVYSIVSASFKVQECLKFNSYFRPDECPCGEWAIDWVKSLRKYVKPSVADEVERVIALFTSVTMTCNQMWSKNVKLFEKYFLKRIIAADWDSCALKK